MNILKLPVSITNWIIISDSLNETIDRRLYIKLFKDYMAFLPVYKVAEICIVAQLHLSESDFQCVLDVMWKCVALLQER